jgi:hypothetical protein
MDRKARYSVLFGPFIRGGTGSGWLTGLISPAGNAAVPGATEIHTASSGQRMKVRLV